MLNQVSMRGQITRKCDLRYLPDDKIVCTTGLATNRYFQTQDGSRGKDVCFVDITFYGRSAEIANQYLSVGKKVTVSGYLKYDQWTDQQGNKQSQHSIIVKTLKMADTTRKSLHQ